MAPRQSCSSLLDDCVAVRPGEGEGPHVRQAARAETPRTRELALQVRREPLDHLRAPALLVTPVGERLADRPVQTEQLGVGLADDLRLGRADALLQLLEQLRVVVREREVFAAAWAMTTMRPVFTRPTTKRTAAGFQGGAWPACGG